MITDNFKKLLFFLFVVPIISCSQNNDETVNGVLWEYLEWEINDVSYSNNPYDLIAKVYFIHEGSNDTITTEMFFDENNTWKFRFTGTRLGVWEFTSTSDNQQLDKLDGTINITNNPSKDATGFLVNYGNKFAIQTTQDSVKGILFNVYMNKTKPEYSFRTGNYSDFINYSKEAKNNGCSVIFSNVVANSWFNFPTLNTNEGIKTNPDPATFRKLEEMISSAREEGVLVHIWAWGDQQREQTPINVGEGINGKEDKRLQRYIAARLGALPGWSLGYGFDLHEWVTKDGPQPINDWIDYMNTQLGWNHFLSARGLNLEKQNTINSYDGFGRLEANLFTTPYGPQNYNEVLEDISHDKTKPHFYEERHSYNRQDAASTITNGDWDLDMDGTRRLMWWEAMSGGVGGWFGFYEDGSFPFGGHPYPNSEQLKTHREFWIENNRFLLNLEVDSTFSNGYGLLTDDDKNYIIYKENTSNVQFRLSNLDQVFPIIAVDTKLTYNELYLGELPSGNHDWELPYISDWVIAVGNFEQSQSFQPSDTTTQNNVELDEFLFSQPNNNIKLEWATESEKNLIRFEVEKSILGDSLDWQTIGFLVGKGTNETGYVYSFTDRPDYKNNLLFYRLKMVFLDNSFVYSENIRVENTPTDFSLNQNYPNPFNNSTIIEFSLPYNSNVDLSIYNILGQKIISLVNEELETGYYSYNLDASKLSSGVYYYRLISRDHLLTKKMLYVK